MKILIFILFIFVTSAFGKVLHFVGDNDFAPFSYIKDNKFYGSDIDLL